MSAKQHTADDRTGNEMTRDVGYLHFVVGMKFLYQYSS
jgi:hypothetical protein